MVLLVLFALVAGAGTALSPCVLPVLPAVLVGGGDRRSAAAARRRLRAGALLHVRDRRARLRDRGARAAERPGATLAIVTLLAFGVLLLVPPLSDRVEAWISRIVPGRRGGRGDGFGSGLSSAPASASSTRRAPARSSPG